MSFSPTGKIASSRQKISGENDGTAHGARQFSALLKLCGIKKCEAVYSHLLNVSKNYGLSVQRTQAQRILTQAQEFRFFSAAQFLRVQNVLHGGNTMSQNEFELPPTWMGWQVAIVLFADQSWRCISLIHHSQG